MVYLDEWDAHVIVEELTRDLFRDVHAFRINGDAGAHRLSSALAQVRWRMYRTLPEKAAALHYFLNRDHPYLDGNKRFAVTATDTFLYLNNAALMATDDEVTAFALGVARRDIDLDQSSQFLRERTLRQDWSDAQFTRWLDRVPPEALMLIDDVWDPDGVPVRWSRIYDGVRDVLRRRLN